MKIKILSTIITLLLRVNLLASCSSTNEKTGDKTDVSNLDNVKSKNNKLKTNLTFESPNIVAYCSVQVLFHHRISMGYIFQNLNHPYVLLQNLLYHF